MAYTVICDSCGQPLGNPACTACRRSGGAPALGRAEPAAPVDRRQPARQRPIPGGTRRSDPEPRQDRDPPLTTRECADWMGVTTEYIRGAIDEGIRSGGHLVKLEAETLPGDRRTLRVHLDKFIDFLEAVGWRRIPKRRG